MHGLAASLAQSQLRSVYKTRIEVNDLRLVLRRLVLDYELDDFLYYGREPYQDAGVYEVEHSVEHRDAVHERSLLIHIHKPHDILNQVHEGMEENQCPDDAEHVEEGMGQCCPLGIHVAHGGGDIGSYCGSDVLAQHHRCGHVEVYPPHIQHYERQRYRRAGRLQNKGHHRAQQ